MDTVERLRSLINNVNRDEKMMLPKEIVDIIYGMKEEENWEEISVIDVLQYVADMIE